MKSSTLLALAIFLTGCEFDSQIAPTTSVIEEGTDFDFNFVGNWIAVPSHPGPNDEDEHVYIDFDKKTKEYRARFDSDWPIEMTARAARIAETEYALIDLKLKHKDCVTYRIAYALQKENTLYVWWVSEKRLAIVAKANNFKIEFQRFPLMGTVVRCNHAELLRLALENPKDLAGSTPEVLRRDTQAN